LTRFFTLKLLKYPVKTGNFKAIVFYEDLLKKLEKKFGIKYDKVFRWPTDQLAALNELNEGILLVTAQNDPHRFDSVCFLL
jgi:hypothetical protein